MSAQRDFFRQARCGKKIKPPSVLEKLHSWMYTLPYPAVLGSLLVAFFLTLTDEKPGPNGITTAYLIFLLLYFSSQHVENTLDQENYDGWMFLSDWAELALMFALFMFLGAIGTNWAVDITQVNDSWKFYVLLALAFMSPVIARMCSNKGNPFAEKRGGWLSCLSLTAAVVSLLGLKFPGAVWLFVVLCILLVVYFACFVFTHACK